MELQSMFVINRCSYTEGFVRVEMRFRRKTFSFEWKIKTRDTFQKRLRRKRISKIEITPGKETHFKRE